MADLGSFRRVSLDVMTAKSTVVFHSSCGSKISEICIKDVWLFVKDSLVPSLKNALGLEYLMRAVFQAGHIRVIVSWKKTHAYLYIYIIVFVEKIEVSTSNSRNQGIPKFKTAPKCTVSFGAKTQGHCLVLRHLSPGRPGGGQRWPTGLGDVALGGVADVARGLGVLEDIKVFWVTTVASWSYDHGSFMTVLIGCFSEERSVICEEGTGQELRFVDSSCSGRPGVWLLWILARFRKINDQLMKLMRWKRSCIGNIKEKKMQTTTWCRNRTWWRWRWHWRKWPVQVHSWDSDTSWSGGCLVIGIKGWSILSHYTILCMKLMEGSP